MAELNPAPFRDLVTRLHLEPRRQDALFELPRRKWWLPDGRGTDLGVQFHDQRAGNPAGPAAGPHTQMAQNLLLSYVAGGRILELKTVQVNDRLEIGRPCIDMTNVGYNIEWSQELPVEQSLREYVAGSMLIEMFRRERELSQERLNGAAGDVVYDISVGYDLKGIQSEKVRGFLAGMRDASRIVEEWRGEIPKQFAHARETEYATNLSGSITLSTFHGCPADEIERITEFLIGELDFDVIVKMNPPTLGKERLEHLLNDVMGYTELTVNPKAYGAAISFDESVEMGRRLIDFAAKRGRRVGFKFSNTLEVENHRDFFPPGNDIQYLSGQPLHVITMTLTDELRKHYGPDVPISFSAGIDKQNFPIAVACGFVPVTVSSDLLRPGGYGRMGSYLSALEAEMGSVGASTIDEFIVNWSKPRSHGPTEPRSEGAQGAGRRAQRAETDHKRRSDQSRDREGAHGTGGPSRSEARGGELPNESARAAQVWTAALANTTIAAELARSDPRYRADKNRKVPRRIDSHLTVFDCITCDKCLPVCPNAANFTYPTPLVEFEYRDIIVSPDGKWREAGAARVFKIDKPMQIACYADFCNECGNCDTFCPEYGGPYIEKPSFFGARETWQTAAPRDGFHVSREDGDRWIVGRIKDREYTLAISASNGQSRFESGDIAGTFSCDHQLQSVCAANDDEHRIDMWAYHTLRHLLVGVLDVARINQINAVEVAELT
jgi:putative selenate reductase